MSFDEGRSYQPELDVRDWSALIKTLREDTPNGVLRPLVGPRRSGKTWACQALKGALQDLGAEWLDLRNETNRRRFLSSSKRAGPLLVDEPSPLLDRDNIQGFLRQCARHQDAGRAVLVAMTPGEWATLVAAASADQIQARDLRFIEPLRANQSQRLARAERADWAPDLLAALPERWRNRPHGLELLLKLADQDAALRSDLSTLLGAAIDFAENYQNKYSEYVFYKGLSEAQQALIRLVVRQAAPAGHADLDLLVGCGILRREHGQVVLGDPILAAHLPEPVVLHHVSDVHFGRFAAGAVNPADRSAAGDKLLKALGPAKVTGSYASHLKSSVEAGRGPHLLVVSGDLAEWATAAEFSDARAWIDELAACLATSAHPDLGAGPRVLLTGGNHDVDRDSPRDPATARHAAFAKAFDGYPHPNLHLDVEGRALAVQAYSRVGLQILLLGSAELSQEPSDAAAAATHADLVDKLVAAAKDKVGDEAAYRKALSDLDWADPSLVHHKVLAKLKATKLHQPVKIAVLHHPLSPVPGNLSVSRYGALLNAAEVKSTLINQGFRLVLHGHEHVGFVGEERWHQRKGAAPLFLASAPSLGSTQIGESRGFNQIRVFREGAFHFEVEISRFEQSGDQWIQDGDPVCFSVEVPQN